MTLPSADTSNIVVGENFKDFLSLGLRIGFFELEQIEYQPEEYLEILDSQNYSENLGVEEIALLKSIEKEFDLKPWVNHEKKLSELQDKYLSKLKYSDEYYEVTD